MARRRILVIIAPVDFIDHVATTVQNLLDEAGFQADIGSTMTGTARGMNGTQIPITVDLKEMIPADYEGAILIGGPGFISYFSGYRLLRGKLQELHDSSKLLVGVGEAMLLLARIGVLTGKKIADPLNAESMSTLKREGAMISNEKIVADGNLLTASRDASPRELAIRVLKHLLKEG